MMPPVDAMTIHYMLKSAEQELKDVEIGLKPAALGFWTDIPNSLYKKELVRVYGRYYKWAVAKTQGNLDALVMAYYSPISPESDRELGKALGYVDASIENYISNAKYSLKKMSRMRFVWLKIITTAEKLGWKVVFLALLGAIKGDVNIRNLLVKEGFQCYWNHQVKR